MTIIKNDECSVGKNYNAGQDYIQMTQVICHLSFESFGHFKSLPNTDFTSQSLLISILRKIKLPFLIFILQISYLYQYMQRNKEYK
jgi:hypothetical protein